MSNYSIEQLVKICYDPGIPTDLDVGNISVPELTFNYNLVDSLEFSTFTIGFTAEQLAKKRNGDTFIEELNFMGNSIKNGISKINIKFFYTPLKKTIWWKYDQKNGVSFDYTGIRFKVKIYYPNGTSEDTENFVLDPMAAFDSATDGRWFSPLYLSSYCKAAITYMNNHPGDPVVYSGRENYDTMINSVMG